MLSGARLIAAFGDKSRAVLMYDAATARIRHHLGAECLEVTGGKIARSRLVFDRAAFEPAPGTGPRPGGFLADTSVPRNPSPALQVALAYFDSWTSKDLARAMHHVADDIVCDAPAGQVRGATAYRETLAPFLHILTAARMITAFGNDETALVTYDTTTVPVGSAPAAKCVEVTSGKITRSWIVFDRAPFNAQRAPSRRQ
jgi:hypothetical protein